MRKRDDPDDPTIPPRHIPPIQPPPVNTPPTPPVEGGAPAVPRPGVDAKTAKAVQAIVALYRRDGAGKTFQQFLSDKVAAYIKAHPNDKPKPPPDEPGLESEDPIGWITDIYALATHGVSEIGKIVIEHAITWFIDNAIQIEPAGEQPLSNPPPPVDGGTPPPMGTGQPGEGGGEGGGEGSGDEGGGDEGGGDEGGGDEGSGDEGSGGEGGGGGGGGGCFSGETEVLLGDGKARAIAQLESGEIVMSRDENTGLAAPQRVIHKWVYNSKPTLLLRLTNGDIIETTDPHRFFVSDRGFLPASELTSGMYLKTQTPSDAQISSIERNVRKTEVYNLLVENFHTYFVGATGLWVHNEKVEEEEGGVIKAPPKPAAQE